jgi:hypothetical protein
MMGQTRPIPRTSMLPGEALGESLRAAPTGRPTIGTALFSGLAASAAEPAASKAHLLPSPPASVYNLTGAGPARDQRP